MSKKSRNPFRRGSLNHAGFQLASRDQGVTHEKLKVIVNRVGGNFGRLLRKLRSCQNRAKDPTVVWLTLDKGNRFYIKQIKKATR